MTCSNLGNLGALVHDLLATERSLDDLSSSILRPRPPRPHFPRTTSSSSSFIFFTLFDSLDRSFPFTLVFFASSRLSTRPAFFSLSASPPSPAPLVTLHCLLLAHFLHFLVPSVLVPHRVSFAPFIVLHFFHFHRSSLAQSSSRVFSMFAFSFHVQCLLAFPNSPLLSNASFRIFSALRGTLCSFVCEHSVFRTEVAWRSVWAGMSCIVVGI